MRYKLPGERNCEAVVLHALICYAIAFLAFAVLIGFNNVDQNAKIDELTEKIELHEIAIRGLARRSREALSRDMIVLEALDQRGAIKELEELMKIEVGISERGEK